MFNTKTTSATSSPESASLFTVEMKNEAEDDKHTTNTVSMSTTATVSTVTGTVYSGT